MAKDKEEKVADESKIKTFYLYDYQNLLVTRAKKIYSPYNVKTLGRTPSEDYYNDPDSVEFKNGEYTANETKLGKVRFAQQCEWLSFYNSKGGSLSKGDRTMHQGHFNGRWYKNDGIHKVHIQEIVKVEKKKEEVRIEKVEVQQIPLIVAEGLTVTQLEGLAAEWGVEISDNIRELGDVEKIQGAIIETMKQSGNIK